MIGEDGHMPVFFVVVVGWNVDGMAGAQAAIFTMRSKPYEYGGEKMGG